MSQEIYVKEKPEICWDCLMMANKEGGEAEPYCVLNDAYLGDCKPCPIKSLHDHDKELVEKVCDKINKAICDRCLYFWTPDEEDEYTLFNIDKILDQIQKEFEDE